MLIETCPRCSTVNCTFDIFAKNVLDTTGGWRARYEIFCRCRKCGKSTIFLASNRDFHTSEYYLEGSNLEDGDGYINNDFDIEGYVNIKDFSNSGLPDYMPVNIETIFKEALVCISAECWNAAGAMFRLCIDIASKSKLPSEDTEPNAKIRRSLGLRLDWMFKNGHIPIELAELADCIKEDGNDGAHAGSLTRTDALDLRDFATELFERLYTFPKRLELAAERRASRRQGKEGG